MKVHWTENAIGHLVNIYEYIGANSPTYAKQTVDKITRRSIQIADHPHSGRKVPESKSGSGSNSIHATKANAGSRGRRTPARLVLLPGSAAPQCGNTS
ncbi:type II toxin-antitoxin system RelE/ParE family toxin [Desulfosudis oleivorans]|uniref:type II toxin-antitoxin system RelE/ParE family toxin n=1 Tax=Desulfosudis oleivorans TaxID=181663 RepID=UPI0009FBE172